MMEQIEQQKRYSLHLMSLNVLKQNTEKSWVFAVPSFSYRHKQCDQVSDEFKRAGIGLCMTGEQKNIFNVQVRNGVERLTDQS